MKTPLLTLRFALPAVLFLTLLGGIPCLSQAQQRPSREELTLKRKEYIREKAQLTPSEASALFLVLDELDQQKFKLWRTLHPLHKKIRQGTASDREYRDFLLQKAEIEVQNARLEEAFVQSLLKSYPAERVWRVMDAIHSFAHEHRPKAHKPKR